MLRCASLAEAIDALLRMAQLPDVGRRVILPYASTEVARLLDRLAAELNLKLITGPPPQLPSRSRRSAPSARLLGKRTRTGDSTNRHVVLAVGAEGVPAGLAFALLTGREFRALGDLEECRRAIIRERPVSATIAIPVANMRVKDCTELAQTLLNSGVAGGLLYCPTAELGYWFALKTFLYSCFGQEPGQTIFLPPAEQDTSYVARNNQVILGKGNAQTEAWFERRCDLLAIHTHSNGLDSYFGSRILCSREDATPGDPPPVRALPCFFGADCERQKYWPGRPLLPPSALRADTLFFSTCWGLSAEDGLFDERLSLSRALLLSEKVGNFISSYMLLTSSEQSPLLFYYLYNRQLRLGEIVNRLNAWHQGQYGEPPGFLLFGDPMHRCRSSERIAEIPAHRINKRPLALELGVGMTSFHFRQRTSQSDKVFFVSSPAEEGVLVMSAEDVSSDGRKDLFFSLLSRKRGRVEFKSISTEEIQRHAEFVDRCRDNLGFWNFYLEGLRSHPQIGGESEVATALRYVETGLQNARLNLANVGRGGVHSYEDYNALLAGAAGLVMQAQHRLAGFLSKVVFRIGSMHFKNWAPYYDRDKGSSKRAPCPHCCNQVWVYRYRSILDPRLFRKLHSCVRCGVIADLSGDCMVSMGRDGSLRVRNARRYVTCVTAFEVLEDFNHRQELSSPFREAWLVPGQRLELASELHPTGLVGGAYVQSWIVLANLGFNALPKTIFTKSLA